VLTLLTLRRPLAGRGHLPQAAALHTSQIVLALTPRANHAAGGAQLPQWHAHRAPHL
jgi:hypothetical protein